MRAILIPVGSELLEKSRADTNSEFITRVLMDAGIIVDMKFTVADDVDNLAWLIKTACKRVQLVVITGGLGPTEDDISREAAAKALKKELIFDEKIIDFIRVFFRSRAMPMAEINTRQAFLIEGAEMLANPLGTAPGQYLDLGSCKLLLLPGPPAEMQPMFQKVFTEKIKPAANFQIHTRSLKFAGVSESELDAKIADIYRPYMNIKTTILASPNFIEVHLLGRGRKKFDEIITETNELAQKIIDRLPDFFLTDQDIKFEEYIVNELITEKLTLATAESCTGGKLGNVITNVPGSSKMFLGGVIAYANSTKTKLLGVSPALLEQYGAVSAEVARQMAHGVRQQLGAHIGVAVTGIAGPGGSEQKPEGKVYFHLSAANLDFGYYRLFPGGRRQFKSRTVNSCLLLINQALKKIREKTV